MRVYLKRKVRKTLKSRNREKEVGFSLSSLFPSRKLEVVMHGGTMEPVGYTTCRGGEPRELVSSKVWRTSGLI